MFNMDRISSHFEPSFSMGYSLCRLMIRLIQSFLSASVALLIPTSDVDCEENAIDLYCLVNLEPNAPHRCYHKMVPFYVNVQFNLQFGPLQHFNWKLSCW